jgi:hypothetical protein
LLICSNSNVAVWPNCGGSFRVGVLLDNGAVRSMTSTVPDARAAARSGRTDMVAP